jgi:hypothetical protein
VQTGSSWCVTARKTGLLLALNLLQFGYPTGADIKMQHFKVLIHRLTNSAGAVVRFTLVALASRAMVHLPVSEIHRLKSQLAER